MDVIETANVEQQFQFEPARWRQLADIENFEPDPEERVHSTTHVMSGHVWQISIENTRSVQLITPEHNILSVVTTYETIHGTNQAQKLTSVTYIGPVHGVADVDCPQEELQDKTHVLEKTNANVMLSSRDTVVLDKRLDKMKEQSGMHRDVVDLSISTCAHKLTELT